jgi:hypothetical protein
MKTVEIVTTAKGCFVTRRYCGQNKGREFFPSVAPMGMKKKEAKQFLIDTNQAKERYINEWTGE